LVHPRPPGGGGGGGGIHKGKACNYIYIN
jgi:hypothetical protein